MTDFSNALLERYVLPEKMTEQIYYCLFGSGKRLRMNLLLDVARHFGQIDENIERLAVALELVHTYSLVHDDLPSMDNDDYRRGKPSCHKRFGDDLAILTGDALLNYAMQILAKGKSSQEYLDSISRLFESSGENGMIFGQIIDLKNDCSNFEDYKLICANKTSALFKASLTIPLIYFKADKTILQEYLQMADDFGLAFQIWDDLSETDIEVTSILNFFTVNQARETLNKLIKKIKKYDFLPTISSTLELFEKNN